MWVVGRGSWEMKLEGRRSSRTARNSEMERGEEREGISSWMDWMLLVAGAGRTESSRGFNGV